MIATDLTSQFPFPVHPPVTRHEGVHLSDIINDLYQTLFAKDGDSGDPTLTYELGFLWEDVLSRTFGERLGERIDGTCLDGIWISPDGVRFEDEGIDEYKATKMSMPANLVELPWRWAVQVKGYCYVFGYRRARVFAWYIDGDRRQCRISHRVWGVEFSEQELVENWRMLVGHAVSKGWLVQ